MERGKVAREEDTAARGVKGEAAKCMVRRRRTRMEGTWPAQQRRRHSQLHFPSLLASDRKSVV